MKVSELTEEQCQQILDTALWSGIEIKYIDRKQSLGITAKWSNEHYELWLFALSGNNAYVSRDGCPIAFNICGVVDLLRKWNVEGFE